MTKKQLQYKNNQREIRLHMDDWQCKFPGCYTPGKQLSHRIARTKANIKKHGLEFIDHNINLVTACCLEHNSFWNIGNNPEKCNILYTLYNSHRHGQTLSTEFINNILEVYIK
jgi:hypothetical protein